MTATMDSVVSMLQKNGAVRCYAKLLSPNDNSKNQIYLGGNFSALNILPHERISEDSTSMAGSVRYRVKAHVNFFWVDQNGKCHAPAATLILYPKYPEIRLSGFLKNCERAPSALMSSRAFGRVLIFGVTNAGEVLAYAAEGNSAVAKGLTGGRTLNQIGVFLELQFSSGSDNREQLLKMLRVIHEKRWLMSQKLSRHGVREGYSARNGGGYTLEAELGISPNGFSEPDYLGWEIKQFGVRDFTNFRAKTPVTLFTPEPTGGVYKDHGFEEFMSRYGYADQSGIPNRLNFGGIYGCGRKQNELTGLRMLINGFDAKANTILSMQGSIMLLDSEDTIAAKWQFVDLIAHWNLKHAKAAFVPSLFRTPPPEYCFGARVTLCEGTDFLKFLKAVSSGLIYLDPALKLEQQPGGKPTSKKRNQFRIKHKSLNEIYFGTEIVDL